MKIRIKIQSALMFLGLGAILVFSNFIFSREREALAYNILNVAGMAFILFGFLFRVTARGYKEEKSCNGKCLVKDGPYAVIRNPMYFGTFMIGTGIVVMLLELWVFFLFAVIFLSIYIPQMKKEEAALLEKFGTAYKEYCDKSPKYFPRFDYLLRFNKYITLKPFWVKKELVPIITTLIAVISIEIWKYLKLFGHK